MPMKRTHLPLNALRVFDAAARHLSFTRAADELAVTPAAVGQQICALEDLLGVVLFRRTAKGLELTPEGESGLVSLREGFLQFEDAVRAMQSGQSSQLLTIAAPRDITGRWLATRIAAYRAANPDLKFRLIAADVRPDFTEANLDLALFWSPEVAGLDGVALTEARSVEVARPGSKGDLPVIGWPGDPREAPLQLADAGLAIDAARAGLGKARVPMLLVKHELDQGLLIAVTEPEMTGSAYWLMAPTPQWRQAKVKQLVAALVAG